MTTIPNNPTMNHYMDECVSKGAYVLAVIDGREVRAIVGDTPEGGGAETALDYIDADGDWVEDVPHAKACLVRTAHIGDWKLIEGKFNVWEFAQAAAMVLRAQAGDRQALDSIEYMLEKPWKFRHEAWLGGCDGLETR